MKRPRRFVIPRIDAFISPTRFAGQTCGWRFVSGLVYADGLLCRFYKDTARYHDEVAGLDRIGKDILSIRMIWSRSRLRVYKDNEQSGRISTRSDRDKEFRQMSETTEILLHLLEQQMLQAKQSEDQRTSITNIIVLIAAAIQGVLTQTGFAKNALPLTITLIIIGIFGVVATAKLYERFRYHYEVLRQIRKQLEALHPDTAIRTCLDAAWQAHTKNHPITSTKIRLHVIWSTLHILIVALGTIYTVIILLK